MSALDPRGATMIGIDLGGTQLRAARIDAEGRILAAERRPTDRVGGPDAVIGEMKRMVRALRGDTTLGLGIGIPGAIDAEAVTVLNIPALPGWSGIALAERLEAAVGLRCRLDNDAKAATLGEWRVGAGRGCDNFVYVTISTGIGSAAVVDGRLLRGAGGLAGEIGHTRVTDSPERCVCGLTGCWQAVASGIALDREGQRVATGDPASRIGRLAGTAPVTAVHVGEAAREGDPAALRLLALQAELIGYGFANLQHVYSPERIVVGGGVASLLDLMRPGIEATLRARLLPGFRLATITRASLGDDAGVIGAAFRAWEVETSRNRRATRA